MYLIHFRKVRYGLHQNLSEFLLKKQNSPVCTTGESVGKANVELNHHCLMTFIDLTIVPVITLIKYIPVGLSTSENT